MGGRLRRGDPRRGDPALVLDQSRFELRVLGRLSFALLQLGAPGRGFGFEVRQALLLERQPRLFSAERLPRGGYRGGGARGHCVQGGGLIAARPRGGGGGLGHLVGGLGSVRLRLADRGDRVRLGLQGPVGRIEGLGQRGLGGRTAAPGPGRRVLHQGAFGDQLIEFARRGDREASGVTDRQQPLGQRLLGLGAVGDRLLGRGGQRVIGAAGQAGGVRGTQQAQARVACPGAQFVAHHDRHAGGHRVHWIAQALQLAPQGRGGGAPAAGGGGRGALGQFQRVAGAPRLLRGERRATQRLPMGVGGQREILLGRQDGLGAAIAGGGQIGLFGLRNPVLRGGECLVGGGQRRTGLGRLRFGGGQMPFEGGALVTVNLLFFGRRQFVFGGPDTVRRTVDPLRRGRARGLRHRLLGFGGGDAGP